MLQPVQSGLDHLGIGVGRGHPHPEGDRIAHESQAVFVRAFGRNPGARGQAAQSQLIRVDPDVAMGPGVGQIRLQDKGNLRAWGEGQIDGIIQVHLGVTPKPHQDLEADQDDQAQVKDIEQGFAYPVHTRAFSSAVGPEIRGASGNGA